VTIHFDEDAMWRKIRLNSCYEPIGSDVFYIHEPDTMRDITEAAKAILAKLDDGSCKV
jgi:hypothetical protein